MKTSAKKTVTKISYPLGSVQCIVSGAIENGFEIWCGPGVYEFRKVDTTCNPTTVRCKASGTLPSSDLDLGYVEGTIVYDLDVMESYVPGRPHFLKFKSNTHERETEITWEISTKMFERAFDDDMQVMLCCRRHF